MHHRDCFWKPFGRDRVNESQKHLKSAETYFYPNFSWFWAKLTLKKLILIRSENLGLLANTLTANEEHSRSNGENVPLKIQIKLSDKQLRFLMYFFLSYWLRNICLFKGIKRIVSENSLAVNLLRSPKNSWNLQKNNFILLFHHFEPNWLWKSYF